MKTIVSVQEIDEMEIKPRSEVAEWRRLVACEIETRWEDRSAWITVGCPCCLEGSGRPAFEHASFTYDECTVCGTLYASRRPAEEALDAWYRDSAPAKFWRERLLAASHETRFEKIVEPRAGWILDGIVEYLPKATRLLDVSANGRALVNEVVARTGLLKAVVAGVTADLEGKSASRVSVQPSAVARLLALGPFDLVTALDAFDRAADLPVLVRALRDTLEPGGVMFATVPTASGFEVQSLWERSPTILPPDKLNLPTVSGLLHLFAGPSWELLELSTPGMFDVEIIRRTMSEMPGADWPRALRALVTGADANATQALTEYLQSRRLSSFARLVARRVG